MSDQAALLAAIVAHPDDDTPRLVYADWLDEHQPDPTPSPSSGPSARAEYIRLQCRLAAQPYDDPDYPELIEREADLAEWLQTHTPTPDAEPDLPEYLNWYGGFDAGDGRLYHRGFPVETEYTDYEDDAQENVDRILPALTEVFARSTLRTLRMEDAYGAEIAGVVGGPAAAGLRGLCVGDIADDDERLAARAIAESPHLTELRRLLIEFSIDDESVRRLAESPHLGALEELWLEYPSAAALRPLGRARWLRGLRVLGLWLEDRDALKAVGEFGPMPNLQSLSLRAATAPSAVGMRKFAASESFPRLARLEYNCGRLTPELVALLARGEWPLRHLRLNRVPVRKLGAEALAGSAFAGSLRVLELSDADITAGGAQALAGCAALANLRHLDLSENPLGVGGLAALARSPHLRGLRVLSLSGCNTAKAPLTAAAVLNFLSALDAPDLRHLSLDRLPVGVRGARVLAAGGTYANLTRLSLRECGLRENGARAIVESAALANLTSLNLADNAAGKGVAKLADPQTLPRLGITNLCVNRIPKAALARLRKRPGVLL